jgi:putative transposase
MNIKVPPKLSISEFVGYLKGKSALMLYEQHPEQRSKWDKSFWARGYYVATVGTVTEEVIRNYVAEQEEDSRKSDKS